ncbi:hypothetical protein QYF61_013675 [Mycteria americana]|uniref:Nucleoside-diphosphate kinase n=1 Tax=Mycteria americana TaxID=33587 RepID=A0AAN7NE96_MYCAM|nr:hypothetical protein QYF61_013675 [Mycteria americana]
MKVLDNFMASQEEKQAQPFADIFNEDEAEKSFLLSKPTCLIILGKPKGIYCSDYDLCQRISGQRQHPDSGQVYQRNQWDPNVIEKHKKDKDQHEEDDEEQEEEETAEDPLMMSEFLHQLVQRPEDFLENAEERVGAYKDIMLHPLEIYCMEDLMAEQDCQYLIELDGNQQPDDLIISVVVRLQSLGVRNGAPITRLQSQQEEMLEGLENVLDMAKLIQPYMEESREDNVEQVQRDAVEKAITAVKNRLELEKQSREPEFEDNDEQLPPESEQMPQKQSSDSAGYKEESKPTACQDTVRANCSEGNRELGAECGNTAIRAGPGSQSLSQHPSQEQGSSGPGHWAPPWGQGRAEARLGCQPVGGPSSAQPVAMQGCGEVVTGPAVALLGQGLAARGADMESWAVGRWREPQGPGQGQPGPGVPSEIILPEFAEDDFPDIPEMEIIKRKIDLFMHDWQTVESEIKQSSLVQVVALEIAEQTPESLLNQTVLVMEKPFKYHGWELSAEDLDEEAEDLAAEGEDEEEVEEEENADEEDEEKTKEKKRHMGDTKHFCPVSLKENFVLYPGLYEHAAKYQEKIYYFSTSEYRDKFLKNPEDYVAHNEPLQAPPLRVCLLGTHGAGKTTCARQIADKLGIFHIQFEEYLQELILPKTKAKVGPNFDEELEEDDNKMPMLSQELDSFSQTMTKTEIEKSKEEVELTDEEEAIKANLMDNEPLPPEVLDNIVLDWWRKEPFRSTGFILDGFPRTLDEAQYLSERGLCPDVAVYIQVEESDVLDRLFPPRLKKWKERQYKKMENKKKLKDLKAKIRDERIARRREELLAERKQKKQEASANKEHYEATEEEDENENEDVEAILEEEFLEEEEEEEEAEEEQEIDAVDRIQNEITEKFDSEIDRLQGVQEELEKLLIPQIEINGGRKPHIVRYQIYSKLNSLMESRGSIFEKCYPISLPLAHKMLVFSYKFPSSFGQWDPIKTLHQLRCPSLDTLQHLNVLLVVRGPKLNTVFELSEGDAIKPQQSHERTGFPVIHRQYIYFFSSKENKETFMKNPIKYICQPKPKPAVPVKIAIVGPPKSGKTTVAKKFASVYGLLRLSMGDAIRLVLNNQPESELALLLKWHLHKGLTVPDELAIQALDVALMNHVCNTTGVVIDGYPVTRKQVNLLESARIIPVKIFELEMDAKEVFRRALLDKESTNRSPYPDHDSSQILAIKNSCYKQHIDAIRTYYKKEHQNWCVIDAFQSKWWIWNKVLKEVQVVVKEIQIYLERIREGKAAGIADLCITPEELQYRLGEFGQYCPVSLAEKGELVDCSVTSSLQFAAEFRGHYYKMASQEELDKFLSRPEVYVPPLAPHPLPPPDMLPKKLTAAEVKALFPRSAEMQGYCPVTYLDGKQRYEALVPGNIECAAKYQDKVYIFESEEKLLKFMSLYILEVLTIYLVRLPEKYWNLKLPRKLPPIKEPILLTALPLAGYLEQASFCFSILKHDFAMYSISHPGVATSLIKALSEVGCLKPKFPFLSVKKTALLFVACHLKAHNPRSSEPARQAYQRKLARFTEHCQLVPYLGAAMAGPYRQPGRRPPGFDCRLRTFLSLKDASPSFV